MLAAILGLITNLFPSVLKTVGQMYADKVKLEGDENVLRASMASQAMQLEALQAQLDTQLKLSMKWWSVEALFGYVTLFYYSKVLVWDLVLGLGSTPTVKGLVAEWAGYVIAFFFGHVTVLSALKIWRAK